MTTEARGDAMEERMFALERRHEELATRLDALEKTLEENTKTTNAIKSDTGQIVALFKASLLGASIVKWLATVGGAFIVGYAAYKGLTAR